MSNPKEITIEGALYRLVEQDACDAAWERRCKLYAEGDKLYAGGDKLRAEGDKLCAGGSKLYAGGSKLYAEGRKLCAEGDIVFLEAVIAMYGDIVLTWTAGGCTLGNGRTFKEATDEPR